MIDSAVRDLSFGLRMLRRRPALAALVVVCLGLGIGANAAVCSWIEGILLRPYPAVAHQERMFALIGTNAGTGERDALSWPDWLDLRRECTLVESFVADKIMGTTLSIGDRASRVTGSTVSANYFDALGVRPIRGRGFLPEEERGRNAHPVTVVAYSTWKELYGGDPDIIGKVQRLNGVEHTIVGVAPPGFYGTFVGWSMQFFVPASMVEAFDVGTPKLDDRAARWIEGYVLLRPGVTREQAQQQLSAAAARLAQQYPATNRGRGVRLLPLWQTPFNGAEVMRPTLGVTLAVVALVLVIACANVGNLLFVRALTRRREMALRLAVGAGRRRLVGQLLVESLILATLAAAAGVGMAHACRDLLVAFFPASGGTAPNLRGQLDGRVLAICFGLGMLTTLLAGLLPALQASRLDPAAVLTAESSAVVGARGKGRLRGALVVLQVALSFALLVGAGLLVQSLRGMSQANPGFSTRVRTTYLDLKAAGYDESHARGLADALLERVRALPGVDAAAYARVRPFTFVPYSREPITVPGYTPAPDEQPTAESNEVSPGYLATLGIPLLAGRDIGDADDEKAAPVAVIDETMAARYFHGRDPLGLTFQVKGQAVRVIGVARAAKYESLLETARPFYYAPLRQRPATRGSLFVRSTLAGGALAAALAREIHTLDSSLAPGELIPMREQLRRMTSPQRIAASLLAVFGALALALAAIGLYGVLAESVAQERRELGLRIALGASRSRVLRGVLARGLALTAAGAVLGAGLALAAAGRLGGLLFGIGPRDPSTFAAAFAVMIVVASFACSVPALRATRTNPLQSLRP